MSAPAPSPTLEQEGEHFVRTHDGPAARLVRRLLTALSDARVPASEPYDVAAWGRVEDLETALLPFAKMGQRFFITGDGSWHDAMGVITGTDLRRALEIMKGRGV